MNKKLMYAIILAILCTFFTALGQLLMKIGMSSFKLSLQAFITNYALLCGLLVYLVGGVVMIFAFKQADLSLVYPFLSLSFIWVALISAFILGEKIILTHGLGIAIIILGVYFVGRGATHA
ncbi:hypothetical protein JW756_02785 [Candidatus Woesearchaeota archaeon]|nr:hypothetical protein [Candidatus Woesearchaeota archaeon]